MEDLEQPTASEEKATAEGSNSHEPDVKAGENNEEDLSAMEDQSPDEEKQCNGQKVCTCV